MTDPLLPGSIAAMDVTQVNRPDFKDIPHRKVRIKLNIGPFAGLEGIAIAQDSRLLWIRIEGGHYAPYDKPGTFGILPEYVEDL